MPQLDVSEVFADGDMCDDFTVLRSNRSIGADGLTVDAPHQLPAWGSVQPSSPEELKLLPETERTDAYITVITQTRLVPLSDQTAPDRVVWENRTWQVVQVSDWSSWGDGFCSAICELIDMTVQAP